MITEKCLFCDKIYKSTIDKKFDICPNCEESALEDYNTTDFKEMVMTYNDQTKQTYK